MRPSGTTPRAAAGVAVDAAGTVLVFLGVYWATRIARSVGGDASTVGVFGAVAVAAYLFGRAAGRVVAWLPAALIVAGTATLTVFPLPDVGTYPSGLKFGPLEYANASAALYLLTAAAGVAIARLDIARIGRWFGVVVALLASFAVLVSGSAASMSLLSLLLVGAFIRGRRATQLLLAGSGLVLLLVVAGSCLLAHQYASQPDGALVRATSGALSPERLAYWSEALALAERNPDTGIGPGRFRQIAPSARGNVDAVAVHNEYLQAGAELGIPGALILLMLFGWGFLRLALNSGHPSVAPVAAGLAAVGIHASVDYVLHAPAVVVAVAMLVATGAGPLSNRHGQFVDRRPPLTHREEPSS